MVRIDDAPNRSRSRRLILGEHDLSTARRTRVDNQRIIFKEGIGVVGVAPILKISLGKDAQAAKSATGPTWLAAPTDTTTRGKNHNGCVALFISSPRPAQGVESSTFEPGTHSIGLRLQGNKNQNLNRAFDL